MDKFGKKSNNNIIKNREIKTMQADKKIFVMGDTSVYSLIPAPDDV